MNVLILGCGPAGLMAAHAASRVGAEPIILSRKRKSPMRGAQYLHAPIPGMPKYEFKIRYSLIGTVDGYRSKVYGPESAVETSVDSLQGLTPAWDIRAVYDQLWAAYRPLVIDWDATPAATLEAQMKYSPDLTISTIPAKLLCWKPSHRFASAAVLISEDAQSIPAGIGNQVVCSGRPEHRWYRQSRINDWCNTEYPYQAPGPYTDNGSRLVRVDKPLGTDCACFPRVHRMGRYGRWTKGVLSHTAFAETTELIQWHQNGA